ncbi:tRNA modification GTPase TrmE [Verruconis gallopava]|uniref:tRNA modification GTPase TrmE n=1 Tax=Verruconis gallopava TaxID=253628 RepID=A0A0D1YCH3_9PEZI|nr:tRNA modification GTPase TrmE [Verruconis gallopava]KIV98386.1 tRNA modification GTPase TrmE [Verruconis gallopava]
MLLKTLACFQRRVIRRSFRTIAAAQPFLHYVVYSNHVARPFSPSRSTFSTLYAPRMRDTIYALSTPSGKSAIAVVRISGPACSDIYRALCPNSPLPKPRFATVRTLYDPTSPSDMDSVLDHEALVLFFPSPHTATGEDILELHVHGGPAVIKAVLQAIPQCGSAHNRVRYAEPGEFTQRAFYNNRLDLTQVEALGDILAATTEQQRILSIRGMTKTLTQRYNQWRTKLQHARGELEGLIDFSEDQHFDESSETLLSSVASQVRHLKNLIELHVQNATRGELLRNGISVAFLGGPNVGKSSLLNRVVDREAAIVSNEAGTTRDIVEIGMDLGGYLCRFSDMAGLRGKHNTTNQQEQVGAIELEGIRRAKQRALESNVVVVITEVQRDYTGEACLLLDNEVTDIAAQCAAQGNHMLAVVNKIDRIDDKQVSPNSHWNSLKHQFHRFLPFIEPNSIIMTSCTSPGHEGIHNFQEALVAIFKSMTKAISVDTHSGSPLHESLGATERQRRLLQTCLQFLNSFLSEIPMIPSRDIGDIDIVAAAEALRAAADSLAKITGHGSAGDVEEVLGVVFEKFCVGK